MLTLRCRICLDVMGNDSTPMATQCGHIYCLDCATFHFAQADPFCAVCRKSQTLETMVRLFLDTEDDSTRENKSEVAHEEEQLSSSPVSVRSIERAGEDAVSMVKQAIAGREDMQDALLSCNTFVNCVTPREQPHINQELLREISFQLMLVQTELKDHEERFSRLKQEVQVARGAETAARLQSDEHRRLARRTEKQRLATAEDLRIQGERYQEIYQQLVVASEDANRQRVWAGKVLNELDEMKKEMESWREQAAKAKRKYYALKNDMKAWKQAAQGGTRRGHTRAGSDDLEIV
ncbi:hypothetical protein C8Q78DRAFT_1077062 [Trametes maxima]|nr:hypothetical protein C8Q78DRAFT_1077062 [Trametes maxima]